MTTLTDNRPHLAAAYAQAADFATTLTPKDATRRTPCDDLDVAALLDHLVFAARRAADLGLGRIEDDQDFPHVPLDQAATAIRRAAEEAAANWSDDRLDARITMPWGMVYSGADLVDMYTMELVTHTWDLAHAVGRSDGLDESLASVAIAAAHRLVPAEYRGDEMPFGPEVAAPAGAGGYGQLAAFLGRDPS